MPHKYEIDVQVREAERSDSRAMLALLQELQGETDYLCIDTEITLEEQRELIIKYKEHPRSIMLVIEIDGQLVGTANVNVESHEELKHNAEIGMAILRDFWGHDIGSFVLEELIHYCETIDIHSISFEVRSDNMRALHLYRKYGFETIGVLKDYVEINFRYYDCDIMQKLLD